MFLLKHIDRETIKMSNGKKILQLLYSEDELTKQDISKKLGISLPTVTHNINTLMDEGFVVDAGVADSTGGRKPLMVRFNPKAQFTVGVDIKPKEILILVTDLKSNKVGQRTLPLEHHLIDDVMQEIHKELQEILEVNDINNKQLLGIGFSLHGTVNDNELIFEMAPHSTYKNISFHKYEELFGTPIYIENEANVSAIAESILGKAKQMRNVVYLSINEGVGTGIIIGGYLYKGKNHRAGEFGHMIIDPKGPVCSCGNNGCLETFISTKGLQRMYFDQAGNQASVKEIFKAYEAKESHAVEALNHYISYLAISIRNILFAMDPHYIIIGGVMSKYGNILHDRLIEDVYRNNHFYNEKDNKILMSELNGDAAVFGASLLPLLQLLNGTQKVI